jgi:hypothetical protein
MFEDAWPLPSVQPWFIYKNSFDKRNLCATEREAGTGKDRRKAAHRMADTIPQGSTVILLGHDVLRAFSMKDRPLEAILIHPQVHGGVTWRWLPHPSGRSTIYNDPVFRMLAGLTLVDVLP